MARCCGSMIGGPAGRAAEESIGYGLEVYEGKANCARSESGAPPHVALRGRTWRSLLRHQRGPAGVNSAQQLHPFLRLQPLASSCREEDVRESGAARPCSCAKMDRFPTQAELLKCCGAIKEQAAQAPQAVTERRWRTGCSKPGAAVQRRDKSENQNAHCCARRATLPIPGAQDRPDAPPAPPF